MRESPWVKGYLRLSSSVRNILKPCYTMLPNISKHWIKQLQDQTAQLTAHSSVFPPFGIRMTRRKEDIIIVFRRILDGIVVFLLLVALSKAESGPNIQNNNDLKLSSRVCEAHWIQSALSIFNKYKFGVEQILETVAPSPIISTAINQGLNSTQRKLAFLTSFGVGKNFSSPSQELWARGIVRFYLNQASSAVLNNIGGFSIGRQVELVNLCRGMVDEIQRNVNLCSSRLLYLGESHFQSGSICLQSPEFQATGRVNQSIGYPPVSYVFPTNCQTLWHPVKNSVESAIEAITALLSQHKDVIPNAENLIEELNAKHAIYNRFVSALSSGSNSMNTTYKTLSEWMKWKSERLREILKDISTVMDPIFEILPSEIQQLIRDKCEASSAIVERARALEAQCRKLAFKAPEARKKKTCWLSNKAVDSNVVTADLRENGLSGMASNRYPPPPTTEEPFPKDCQDLFIPAGKIRTTAINSLVNPLNQLQYELPNVNLSVIIDQLRAKASALSHFSRELRHSGENSFSKSYKTLEEWVTWKRHRFLEMDREMAASLDSVFGSLTPQIKKLIKDHCVVYYKAIHDISVHEAECLGIKIEPAGEEFKNEKFCWLSKTALSHTTPEIGYPTILPPFYQVPDVAPRVAPIPKSLCTKAVWVTLASVRDAAWNSVLTALRGVPDPAINTTLVAGLTEQFEEQNKFLNDLRDGKFQSIKNSKTINEWVLWRIEQFQKLHQASSTLVDVVSKQLGNDAHRILGETCSTYKKAVDTASDAESICLGIHLEPAGNAVGCPFSKRAMT